MTKPSRRHVRVAATLQITIACIAACADPSSGNEPRSSASGGLGGAAGTSAAGSAGSGASIAGTFGNGGSAVNAGGSAGSAGAASGSGGVSGSAGGSLSGSGGAPAGSGGGGGSGNAPACDLPATFQWTTGAPVIVPRSDASHDLVAVKDPTVVHFNDRWHVYASSVSSSGVYGMVYASFSDWANMANATWYYMDQTPGFNTYVAAPQLFYFSPQNKWYLIFQSGPPMYSTAPDPGDPTKWTPPAPFFASEPAIITQNGGWLDFWVICDDAFCHLFFSDDHGRWYKSKTPIGSFPNGMDTPVVVMQDAEAGRLFEGSNVYRVAGANKYFALIEAFDSTSNWRRYFRSWTSESLEGPWTPYRDSGTAPFAGKQNVAFQGAVWTDNISHGEMIRAGYDQTLTIDACNLGFLYQGFDPVADGSEYNKLPWRLGLLNPL